MKLSDITITDFDMIYGALEAGYECKGISKAIELTRSETMDALNDVGIAIIRDGEVRGEDGRYISYQDWLDENELTEEDVQHIAFLIESRKENYATVSRVMNNFRKAI